MTLPDFTTERLGLRPRAMADFAACLAVVPDKHPDPTRRYASTRAAWSKWA